MKTWNESEIENGILRIANTFAEPRMPSNSEVFAHEGNYALAVAIQKHGGYKYWAKKLGLEQKYSETVLGLAGEKDVADCLRSLGFEVKETSVKHPYDLLINGCVKVDAKTANTSYIRGCPVHAYRLAKRDHTCDFYIFYEHDTLRKYVVPAHKCHGQVQVEMGIGSKAYSEYLNAFHRLAEASDFYKAM